MTKKTYAYIALVLCFGMGVCVVLGEIIYGWMFAPPLLYIFHKVDNMKRTPPIPFHTFKPAKIAELYFNNEITLGQINNMADKAQYSNEVHKYNKKMKKTKKIIKGIQDQLKSL